MEVNLYIEMEKISWKDSVRRGEPVKVRIYWIKENQYLKDEWERKLQVSSQMYNSRPLRFNVCQKEACILN